MSLTQQKNLLLSPNGATAQKLGSVDTRLGAQERSPTGSVTIIGGGTGAISGITDTPNIDLALSVGGTLSGDLKPQIALPTTGVTGGALLGGDALVYRDAGNTVGIKGTAGTASALRIRTPTVGTANPGETGYIDFYDGSTPRWRMQKQGGQDLAFIDLTNNLTRLKLVASTGSVQIATLPTGDAGGAIFLQTTLKWAGTESKQRASVSHTAGFSGGIAGRGQTNDDIPTLDQINNALGDGFTQWEGFATRMPTSGLGFNDRGTWCGHVSDVWMPEMAALVGVSATTNATPVQVTYAGADQTWGYTAVLDGDHNIGATTITVKATSGMTGTSAQPTNMFRSSGQIKCGTETLTYTSKTATTFILSSPTTTGLGTGATVYELNSLRTGDSVYINGTGISALDGKNFTVTVVDATHFTLDGTTAPGSAYAGSPAGAVARKLIYREGIGFISDVKVDSRGAYAVAAELDCTPSVPARTGGILMSVFPSIPYSSWDQPGIFGANSPYRDFGCFGVKIQNTSATNQAGTAVLINSVSSSAKWKRALVINNGSAPNAPGTDDLCITGTGRIGFGVTENQTSTVDARIHLPQSTAITGGIQWGTSSYLNLYRNASNSLRLEVPTGALTFQLNVATAGQEALLGFADGGTPIWRIRKLNTAGNLDLAFTYVPTNVTMMRFFAGGALQVAHQPASGGPALDLQPGSTWAAAAPTRLSVVASTGFSGGVAGRGLSNDDVPTDDKINGFASAFTQWTGYSFTADTGSSFNDRGTVCGFVSDVTASPVAATVAISNVTNVTNPTVTYAGAHATWPTLATGDSVYISGTGTALDNKSWTVASTPLSTTFTITTAAPGAYSATTPLVRKLIYHEALGIIARSTVASGSQGAYAPAAELNCDPAVPARSYSIFCSVNPTTAYSTWNDPAIFGANSSWLDTGVRGIQVQNTAGIEGGTALFINAVNSSFPWHSAIVVNNGSAPNARGTDVWRVSGTGILTSGGGQTAYSGVTPTKGWVMGGGFSLTTALTNFGSVGSSIPTANTVYFIAVELTRNQTFTGIGFALGTAVPAGTEKVIVGLFDEAGNRVAVSSSSGTTFGTTASVWVDVPFTGGVYTAKGPGRYFIAVQFDTTTSNGLRVFSFAAGNSARHLSGSATPGSFAMPSSITPPTTGASLQAPVSYLYG